MAKRIKAVVRLQIPAGKANPAPPIGTALGPHGVNIMMFCKEYNARTAEQAGQIIPADELKMKDLNVNDIEAAERTIAGTARSMGITIS